MILIAIGANLAADGFNSPLTTCLAAVSALDDLPDIDVAAVSRWYESEPVPASDQPWYVNGVVLIETDLEPQALMAELHRMEATFGRVRRTRNEARPLDLDIIDYNGRAEPGDTKTGLPILPHPRMAERAFVLMPLRDLLHEVGATDWRHPTTGQGIGGLIAMASTLNTGPVPGIRQATESGA
jgi:2-amino-4-hydroxy-6-hydroxymethyldihydropteridine diphosphokinase